MNVLLAGDWHGDSVWAVNSIHAAQNENVEAIIHLGDFGFWSGTAGNEYLKTVVDALHTPNHPVMLFVVPGNHENWDYIDSIPQNPETGWKTITPYFHIIPRGHRWVWSNTTFGALPGAVSLDREHRTWGVSWWTQEQCHPKDIHALAAGGKVDVLLTHDAPDFVDLGLPPLSNGMWSASVIADSEAHRRMLTEAVDILQPKHLVHGHMHVYGHRTYPTSYGNVEVLSLSEEYSLGNLRVANIENGRITHLHLPNYHH